MKAKVLKRRKLSDLEEGSLRVLTPREGIRRAQELVRSYIPKEQRLADELIADRRKGGS